MTVNINKAMPSNAAGVRPHLTRMAEQRERALEHVNAFEARGVSASDPSERVRVLVESELMRLAINMENDVLKAFDEWPTSRDALGSLKKFRALLRQLHRAAELGLDTNAGSKPLAEFDDTRHATRKTRQPASPPEAAAEKGRDMP